MCPRSWVTPGTAELIRDFLSERENGSYPRQIYKALKGQVEAMGFKPPTYDSVRKMIYALHRLGLIRKVRTEKVRENPTAFRRVFYVAVRTRLKDPAWENPTTALYYPEEFKRQRRWPKPKPEAWMEKIRAKKLTRQ